MIARWASWICAGMVGCAPAAPGLGCPDGLEVVTRAREGGGGTVFVCLDGEGRYHGPLVGYDRRGESTVFIVGAARLEAPDGRWECTRSPGGERLIIEYDAEAFARRLWGVNLYELSPPTDGHRMGPDPHVVCPCVDNWEELTRNGFEVDLAGKLEEKGVVTSARYEPPSSP